jgi:HK97 family phage major capsid protein
MTIIEMKENLAKTLEASKALLAENKLEDANAKFEEAEKIKASIELAEKLDAEEKAEVSAKAPAIIKQEKSSVSKFADAIRTGFRNTVTGMSEGVAADGGYTVPEDISTQINTFKEASFSLMPYVDVENVSTMSGARTYKTREQMTGFAPVAEGAAIGAVDGPKFERITYTIGKYAGVLPVTNELLADTDSNLVGTITKWIADESNVGRTLAIIDKWGDIAPTPETFADLDDIKKAANVTLGQAFADSCAIYTNDDGLQYFDTLKDGNSRYLLQPNPAQPAELRLQVGARTLPIVVIPNALLETNPETGAIPVAIGDMKEAIKVFDRQLITIESSRTASVGNFNAFENDLTLYRAIERYDVVVKDSGALVLGFLEVE